MARKKKSKRKHKTQDEDSSEKRSLSTNQQSRADGSNEFTSESRNNPLLQQQQAFLATLSETQRDNFFCTNTLDPEQRAELWMRQADLGERLVNQYSWATPDDRALHVLAQFAPLIEVGCGANAYWCRQMQQAGIDVIGFDRNPSGGGKIGAADCNRNGKGVFIVRKGGPEVLSAPEHAGRTLFLCYPDENNDDVEASESPQQAGATIDAPLSMGQACLATYTGECIIHVGELYGDTTLSMEQAPWGRSSSPDFQEQLAAQFHCVLRAALPSWLHVRDGISVWKRSRTCTLVFADDEETGKQQEDVDEVEYRHIPVDERLPVDIAAPAFQHLLKKGSRSSGEIGEEPSGRRRRKKSDPPSNRPDNVVVGVDAKESEAYECPW